MSRITAVVFGLVGLAVGMVAVLSLREATLSTHHHVDPDSELEVLLEVESRGNEPTQTLPEMTEALVLTCRLEINVDPISEVEQVAADQFRMVLRPALDETDRRQFKGCLEDWTIDHLLVDVLEMNERS